MLSPAVSLRMNEEGFLRPVIEPDAEAALDGPSFPLAEVCPGARQRPPRGESKRQHEIFGPYIEAWSAHAVDPAARTSGSSGGVLTALSTWLVESGRVPSVIGAAMDDASPARTRSVEIVTKDEALRAAGSRYAPVENVSRWGGDLHRGLIAKPCEVTAARSFLNAASDSDVSQPPLLSFFCAGTPSQLATDRLISRLGFESPEVTNLRYRGNGWPGDFSVTGRNAAVGTMSYRESWGQHLGRDVQWRCKLCVDGTGGDADLAVGDFWETDSAGFPDFTDRDGSSVLIARTELGLELALAAEAAGVVSLSRLNLGDVAGVQPLQVERRRTLAGRLLGRLLAGTPGPSYRRFGLCRLFFRYPRASVRAAIGTFLRTTGLRRRQ